jgi:uncharacterized membrane protein YdjX (TVP38/TMEM64 family)
MPRLLLRLLPALLLVIVAIVFFANGGLSTLSLTGLAAHLQEWRSAAASAPVGSLAIYIGVYALLAAAGLPIAMVLTLTGGAIFGAVEGALAAILAANVAAVVGYAAARSALGPLVVKWRRDQEGRAAQFVERLRKQAFWPIVSGRLLPVMPFALINVAAGMAKVPLRTFVAATLTGGLPSGILGATLGAGIGETLSAGRLAHAVESPMVWGPMLALSVLAALPAVLRARGVAGGLLPGGGND